VLRSGGQFVGCSWRHEHRYYVYLMHSSSRRALYIGMTNHLHRRVFPHKTQECEGFTGSYDAIRLVYWESFDDVHKTMAREKQLKKLAQREQPMVDCHNESEVQRSGGRLVRKGKF
jgi:predicted GIY-YIG superfamily endonuclease